MANFLLAEYLDEYPAGWYLVASSGTPRYFLIGLQKVYFAVYEQKDAKLKFRFILSIFATFCEHVLNNSF